MMIKNYDDLNDYSKEDLIAVIKVMDEAIDQAKETIDSLCTLNDELLKEHEELKEVREELKNQRLIFDSKF